MPDAFTLTREDLVNTDKSLEALTRNAPHCFDVDFAALNEASVVVSALLKGRKPTHTEEEST